jgi:hypothetical protein
VVAADGEDLDLRLGQPAHLCGEEQSGAEIRPVTVVDVAGDQQEIDFFLDRQIDEAPEGSAGGGADEFGGGGGIGLQPAQRAVEMEVGRVQEAEIGHAGCLSRHGRGRNNGSESRPLGDGGRVAQCDLVLGRLLGKSG